MVPIIRNGENTTSKPVPSIYTCTSAGEIQSVLEDLNKREASVTAQLDTLIASQHELSRDLSRLDILRAQLGPQLVSTRAIGREMLSDAASTATRISAAVKKLDIEQENVQRTLDVVEQVAELKQCVLGVHGSMGAPQDWETAANYLFRAAKIPQDVIEGHFAELIVPTAEVPDPPKVTLDNASEALCGLFLREFEKATKDNDGARITRFFKLFPLIGRAEVGLDAYGRYVCQGVASRARANFSAATGGKRSDGFFYANTLTKLFEKIAEIVDHHEPVVERHYGVGMMKRVIERLQMEADVQGGIILDTWYEERGIDRKLTDIKSYPFSFLVQSFLPAQRSLARSDSPARKGTPVGRRSEDDSVDMKEVDTILNESGVMLGRWNLYSRFLGSKDKRAEQEISTGEATAEVESEGLTMPSYLLESNLFKKVSSHLSTPFSIMASFLLRASLEKSFQIDDTPSGLSLNLSRPLPSQRPFITTSVDDVMYIVAQILQRTLSTSHRPAVASVFPAISRALGTDFIGMIQRKMRDETYPKAIIQGALPPEDKVLGFLILINNLDVSVEYMQRIVASHLDTDAPQLPAIFPFASDAAFVVSELRSIETTFASKSATVLNDALEVLFRQVTKPRIRPMLTDAFRDVEYNVSADESGGAMGEEASETDDIVPRRFASSFNALLKPIKRILTPSTFNQLLGLVLPLLADVLERRLWALQGRVSELGAVRLERDVAGIVREATMGGKYSLREPFARCVGICEVVGLEREEWDEVVNGEGEREWSGKLGMEERVRARGLLVRT